MKQLLSCVLFLCLLVSPSSAVELADSSSTTYLFGLHPLQMIANGFKIELERRPSMSPFSLSISPEFYFGSLEKADKNIMIYANHGTIDVLGYGVNFSGRLYVSSLLDRSSNGNYKRRDIQQPFSNFYVFGAAEYRYFDLTYFNRGWVTIRENGIDVYQMGDIQQNNIIQRIGMNVGIGNTIFFGDSFFFDLFLYSRISKSYQSPANQETKPFTDSFFTLTGNSFAMGFRFGLLFE